MLRIIIILGVIYNSFGQTKYQKDFAYYWNTVDLYFGYFDTQKCNWNQVRKIYQPTVDTIQNDNDFIRLLERTNNELYNGHVSLNVNLASSSKLLPSGTDLWVSYEDKRFVINAIREGFSAQKSGLKPGMRITAYNGTLIDQAIRKFLPRSVEKHTQQMYAHAANSLIAGTHNGERVLTVNDSLTFHLEKSVYKESKQLIESKIIGKNIGYIKINNSLGNNSMIATFDKVLTTLENTDGLILDFRDTPGGGNTTVARAIMGRFITEEMSYQRHRFIYEEKIYGVTRNTIELVAPRGKNYNEPLVILCGKWTGSMGEGITIGFDSMNRAEVVGTDMAGLLGAIYNYTLPESNIGFQIPVEKLYHVNGTPREDFKPKHYILDPREQLSIAIEIIHNKSIER